MTKNNTTATSATPNTSGVAKYMKIEPETFKGWVCEILKEDKFYFAVAFDVAKELAKRHGGSVHSHMHRIRAIRLNIKKLREDLGII